MQQNSIIWLVQQLDKLESENFSPNKVQRIILRALQNEYFAKYDFIRLLKKKSSYYRLISSYMDQLADKKLIERAPVANNSPRDRTPFKLSNLGWMYLIRREYVGLLNFFDDEKRPGDNPFFLDFLRDVLDDDTLRKAADNVYLKSRFQEYLQNLILAVSAAFHEHRVFAKSIKNEHERREALESHIMVRLDFAKRHLLHDLNFMVYAELSTGNDLKITQTLIADRKYAKQLDEFVNKTTIGYLGYNKVAGRTPPPQV